MQHEKQHLYSKIGYPVRTVILYLLFIICFSTGAEAGTNRKYYSAKLEDIGMQLYDHYKIDCLTVQTSIIDGYTITISHNAFQEICHIGFKLFPSVLTKQNPSPVYQFVERYLLELFLLRDDNAINRQLYEDKVSVRFRGERRKDVHTALLKVLSELKTNVSLSITTDNSHYSVLWTEKDHPLLYLRFPIQYELLWGMNKKEIESHFYPDLLISSSVVTGQEDSLSVSSENMQNIGNNRFVWNGEWYAVRSVNTNRYYEQLPDGSYSLIYSLNRPEESVRNLLVLPYDRSVTAIVNQKLYGGKNLSFEIPLIQLLNFCRQEGCEIFVGIEECDSKKIRGMMILLNRSFGYNHVMHFNAGPRMLEHPEKYKIEIQLYAYVPTHNIHSLFSERNNYT